MKWNFPILTKIKKYYLKNGFLKTLGWIVFIVIGTKVVIINGGIGLVNYFLNTEIPYGPILYYLFEVEIVRTLADVGSWR
tara:strand:- start:1695 stop:1934 length:240 start_codon:yes stop_codon:yes gene_type:complete